MLLYSDENYVLKKYKVDLGYPKTVFISILDNNGWFDSVYQKDYIKNCGLVQSILLELASTVTDTEDRSNSQLSKNPVRTNYYK